MFSKQGLFRRVHWSITCRDFYLHFSLLYCFFQIITKFAACLAFGKDHRLNERRLRNRSTTSLFLQELLSVSWLKLLNLLSFWAPEQEHQKVRSGVTILDPARVMTCRSVQPERLAWHFTPRIWGLGKAQKHFWRVSFNCCVKFEIEYKMEWLKSRGRIMPIIFVTHSWFRIEFLKRRKGKSLFALNYFLLLIAVSEKCVGRKCFWSLSI